MFLHFFNYINVLLQVVGVVANFRVSLSFSTTCYYILTINFMKYFGKSVCMMPIFRSIWWWHVIPVNSAWFDYIKNIAFIISNDIVYLASWNKITIIRIFKYDERIFLIRLFKSLKSKISFYRLEIFLAIRYLS